MKPDLKIAFIQDALPFWGGAEKVLASSLEVFPAAEVYTLVYRKEAFRDSIIGNREIHTSFIDRLPAAHRHHRVYLPLMPLAIEQFDLSRFDILISFSYAVAHGILPRPGQLHISYMYTPMRYSWTQPTSSDALTSWLKRVSMHFFRIWDVASANRVDYFIGVSQWIADCIWRVYRRPADVLYPPVNLDDYQPLSPRSNDYLVVSRLEAHKRIDQVVEAFNRLGLPLNVVGEGPERSRLQRMAGPNVRLLGWQSKEQLKERYGRARAFLHAGQEDFGIALVEAQAAGCPVIALQAGAAPEIIKHGETGLLFQDQTVDSLCSAVMEFEKNAGFYNPRIIQENARRFSKDSFLKRFANLVEQYWDQFNRLPHAIDSPFLDYQPVSQRANLYEHTSERPHGS